MTIAKHAASTESAWRQQRYMMCTATTESVQRQQDLQASTEFESDPREGQNRDASGPLAGVCGPMARRPRHTRGPSRARGVARKSLDGPLDLIRNPTIECIYKYTRRHHYVIRILLLHYYKSLCILDYGKRNHNK